MDIKKFIKPKNIVTVNDVKFYHNDKTTVCVINATITDYIINMLQCISWRNFDKNLDDLYDKGFVITVTSKVVCQDTDKFDINIGENIARSKAMDKLYTKVAKICNSVKQIFAKLYNEVENVQYSMFHYGTIENDFYTTFIK